MAKKSQFIRVGELDVPQNYFHLPEEQKRDIVELLAERIYLLVDRHSQPGVNKMTLINMVIDSSIITNEEEEFYEVCQVLVDMRKLLNEQKS